MDNHQAPDGSVGMLYGREGIRVRMPTGVVPTLIGKRPLPVYPDPRAAVEEALSHPVGCAPFEQLARGKRTACILICDITRPVPNHLFLRPLIERLNSAGIALESIVILVATGLHRPNEGEELAEVVGDPWVLQHVRVENHFARDSAAHVDLGFTSVRRTPVKLDRRFVEADIRIATGLVEPHFMAGYSGGRKVIAPGVAHEDTIRTFHSARFMENPAASQCNLEGNPLHEEQLEIVRMLGDVYAINTVIDEQRALSHINCGEVIASHLEAVAFVAESTRVPIGRKFGTVLTSSAGHPLDKTYYQTVKCMVTPLDIVAEGGTIIVVSACEEGIGSEEYRSAQERLVRVGPDAFLKSLLAKDFADIDEWQTEMQLKSTRATRVQLYTTGLKGADRDITGVEMIDSVEEALAQALARSPGGGLAVIPEGPYVVPVVQ
jgi:nickel-dependent lactate racemase